jgi:hypothetical protein
MDRFDLNWPKTDATFYTDGWRCRIVWRQKSGIGGTIDNNAQCIRRLALSLDSAPYLLGALKARGHDRLAAEIESAAQAETVTANAAHATAARNQSATGTRPTVKPVRAGKASNVPKGPAPAAKHEGGQPPLDKWVNALSGSAKFEAAANRRAKIWLELGTLDDEALYLKTPAAKGKQEWVLKRMWPNGDRKAEYVAAEAFKGIAGYLVSRGADPRFVEAVLGACGGSDHSDLTDAADQWRSVMTGTTH